MRPRIGNGVRRGLKLLAAIGWTAFEDPTHPWDQLRVPERRELARALAWIEWHRKHKLDGTALVLNPRKPRGRRRREPLDQLSLPLCETQEGERAG